MQTGLTCTYKAAGFLIRPSAGVYALRASGGVKAAYPVPWIDGVLLVPYLGAYADYYFIKDNATAIVAAGGLPLASTPLLQLQGWSARLTGGRWCMAAGRQQPRCRCRIWRRQATPRSGRSRRKPRCCSRAK